MYLFIFMCVCNRFFMYACIGVNVFYSRKRGRSKKGTMAVKIRPASSKSANVSVIAAISPTRGLLLYDVHLETVNASK